MENELKVIIANVLNVDPALVNDDSSSKTLEKWDSLYHMNIIIAIEEQLGITFDDTEIAGLNSYKALLKAVKRHKNSVGR